MGGVAPIPLSEILAYMQIFRIQDMDERTRFIKMIRALDSKFMAFLADKREKETPQAPGKR